MNQFDKKDFCFTMPVKEFKVSMLKNNVGQLISILFFVMSDLLTMVFRKERKGINYDKWIKLQSTDGDSEKPPLLILSLFKSGILSNVVNLSFQ